ncbi:hypothetical protein Bca101_047837 [Brassica carinata]
MGFDRLSIKEKQWLLWIHEVTVPGSDFSSIRQSPPGTCLHLHQQLSSQLTNLPSSPQDLSNPKTTPNQLAPILNATASIRSPPAPTSCFRISSLRVA